MLVKDLLQGVCRPPVLGIVMSRRIDWVNSVSTLQVIQKVSSTCVDDWGLLKLRNCLAKIPYLLRRRRGEYDSLALGNRDSRIVVPFLSWRFAKP
jgi:hypothetical protein